MNYIIAQTFPHPIIENAEKPLVSIYFPTTRISSGSKENEIRFKNALKIVEAQLQENYPGAAGEKILKSLQEFIGNNTFWNEQYDGLAILASKDDVVVYKLQRDVKEYVEVSDTFYIVPLLNAYQTDDNFQVLVLTQNAFKLYEGNRYAIREVNLPKDEQKGLKDVVGDFYEEGGRNHNSMGSGRAVFGTGSSADDEDQIDVEKYFRWVDRYILDNHSKRTEVPLILATLPENFTQFQEISHNDYLIKDGIKRDAQAMDNNSLRKLAWDVLEPNHIKTLKDLKDRYELSKSKELASSDLTEIAMATLESRVDVLLINLNETIPGKINQSTAKLQFDNGHGDMLNDLALMSLKQNAKVYAVPEDELKIENDVNAIYRFPKA
ncbi:MAG: hypothetical protein GX829_02755 [Clostridium sp.]|nr:hypothetical protein [Clostridium sp.]